MKIRFLFCFFLLGILKLGAQPRTIHVMVALCDNAFQGIVPVPESLGNGKIPSRNLYWGAAYGVKSFFKNKTTDWELVQTIPSANSAILERILFKHKTSEAFLLADAFDGEQIQNCIESFLMQSNGQELEQVIYGNDTLNFGGGADLLAYVGHDGLMDFNVSISFEKPMSKPKDVMILACYSKSYFSPLIKGAGANPILWTTHLMAPEAYTLKAAIDGWLLHEKGTEIEERAAQAYHQYQNCGIKGARFLFTTGY